MYLVMTIHDNVAKDIVLLTADRKKAQERFLKLIDDQQIDEVDDVVKEWALNDGYYETVNGSITYLDLTNAETD